MIKKILSIANFTLPIIFFAILQFNTMSTSFVNIITMTLIIGWIFPFIFPIITGVCILKGSHYKSSIVLNILTLILIILMSYLIINIYDSNLLLILIFYISLGVLNIINTIYLIITYRKISEPQRDYNQKEKQNIKKLKKENNGIIK